MLLLSAALAAPLTPAFPVASVPFTAPTPEAFIPVGWALAGVSGAEAAPRGLSAGGSDVGDLNGDGRPDRVLVVEPASRTGAGAMPACDTCTADNWPRAVLVLEASGTGWLRLGVAAWGDASMSARIEEARLSLTWGRVWSDGEDLRLARYTLVGGKLTTTWSERSLSAPAEDFGEPVRERVREDWKLHERVVERGTPLSFHHKEAFSGERALEESPTAR
jgi:hypothetical protein